MPRQDDDYYDRYGRNYQTSTSTTGASRPTTNYGNAGMFDTPVTSAYRRANTGVPGFEYTHAGEQAWLGAQGDIALGNYYAPSYAPANTGGSSGGGGGYGGGGGGGGGSAITQAMINAMAQALGAQGPQYSYTPVDLPDFQGTNMPAFDPSIWQQALGQINTAVTADQANINRGQTQVTQQLQNNYSNPYATATVNPGVQAPQVGAGLTGGATNPQAANQVNAGNADSQAAFQNVLQLLSAADQSAQNSRLAQVPMDANYASQGLNAQALGLRGQVGMAQTQAQQQWAQQDAERRYQNSLMSQQWNREELSNNAAGANQAALTNYQTNAQSWQAKLQPILDLISQSGGQNLDFSALFRALGVAA